MRSEADKIRFETKFEKRSPNECWEWRGWYFSGGYGGFDYENRATGAHRSSHELYIGPISKGVVICHKCDNKRCVNPNHLFAGTSLDNNLDTLKKKRGNRVRGSACSWSKLDEKQVWHIRNSNLPQVFLAKFYGVDPSHVSMIRSGRRWSHVLVSH